MPAPDTTRFLIAYDVTDDRRRAKLAKRLDDFGARVQYSVFEALLPPPVALGLVPAIKAIIDPSEDRVRVYPLHPWSVENRVLIGHALPAEPPLVPEKFILI